VDFDPGAGVDNHKSNGAWDIYLSKLDPDGNFFWARTWGGLGCDLGGSVAIDGSGNAYITGEFSGMMDFDPGTGVDNHTSDGSWDVFLSKLDTGGYFVWAQTWGGPVYDRGNSVAIDGSGDAYIAGSFQYKVDFDPGAGEDNHKANAYASDAFLSKIGPTGDFVWARTWGGSGDEGGISVAIDGSGNAYIAGSFSETVDFDPGTGVDNRTSNGSYDAFLSKFPPDGNW
jgi:hypothetical protein